MIKFGVILFAMGCFQGAVSPLSGNALLERNTQSLSSPDKKYKVVLSVNGINDSDQSLIIIVDGKELRRYSFEGTLVSAYWSSSGDYVAINNHYGHLGWYVWLISLKDGSLITAHGKVGDPAYDKYIDDRDLPDLLVKAKIELTHIYKNYESDNLREGYYSIVYGWKKDDELMLFSELVFSNLYQRNGDVIRLYSQLSIDSSIRLKNSSAQRVKINDEETLPDEVKRVID